MLLVISGPSGVGKTTITRAVERSLPGSVFSVSATTRPKTDKDIEGVDYHFVDDKTFDKMIAEGEFLEWVDLFGKRYGTPKKWVLEQLARGRLVILEIDVVGAIKIKQQLPEAFGMFIHPPNEETLLQRLRDRKREDEAAVQRRFAEAKREIEQSSAMVQTPRGPMPIYDRHIRNDDLDRAIRDAVRLVSEERFLRAARRRDPE